MEAGLLELFNSEKGTYLDDWLRRAIRRVLQLQFQGINSGFLLRCCTCKKFKPTNHHDPVFLTGLVDASASPPVVLTRLWHNNEFICSDCRAAEAHAGGSGGAAAAGRPPTPPLAGEAGGASNRPQRSRPPLPLPPTTALPAATSDAEDATATIANAMTKTGTKPRGRPPRRPSLPVPAPSLAPEAKGLGSRGDAAAAAGTTGVAQKLSSKDKPAEAGGPAAPEVAPPAQTGPKRQGFGVTDGVAAEPAAADTAGGAGGAAVGMVLREYFEARSNPVQGYTIWKATVAIDYSRNYILALPPSGVSPPDATAAPDARRPASADAAGPSTSAAAAAAAAAGPDLLSCADEAAKAAARYGALLTAAEVERLQSLDFTVPGAALQTLSHALAAIADWVLAPQALETAAPAPVTAPNGAASSGGGGGAKYASSPLVILSAAAAASPLGLAAQLRPWAFAVRNNDDIKTHGTCLRPSLKCLGGRGVGKAPTSLLEVLNAPPLRFSLARELLARTDRPLGLLPNTVAPAAAGGGGAGPAAGGGYKLRPGWVLPLQRLAALLRRRNRKTQIGAWKLPPHNLTARLEELMEGDVSYNKDALAALARGADGGAANQQQTADGEGGSGSGGTRAAAALSPVDAFLRDLGATRQQVLDALRLGDIDANVGFCVECGHLGEMVACDTCVDSFCAECLGQDPADLPDNWRCKYCQPLFPSDSATIGVAGHARFLHGLPLGGAAAVVAAAQPRVKQEPGGGGGVEADDDREEDGAAVEQEEEMYEGTEGEEISDEEEEEEEEGEDADDDGEAVVAGDGVGAEQTDEGEEDQREGAVAGTGGVDAKAPGGAKRPRGAGDGGEEEGEEEGKAPLLPEAAAATLTPGTKLRKITRLRQAAAGERALRSGADAAVAGHGSGDGDGDQRMAQDGLEDEVPEAGGGGGVGKRRRHGKAVVISDGEEEEEAGPPQKAQRRDPDAAAAGGGGGLEGQGQAAEDEDDFRSAASEPGGVSQAAEEGSEMESGGRRAAVAAGAGVEAVGQQRGGDAPGAAATAVADVEMAEQQPQEEDESEGEGLSSSSSDEGEASPVRQGADGGTGGGRRVGRGRRDDDFKLSEEDGEEEDGESDGEDAEEDAVDSADEGAEGQPAGRAAGSSGGGDDDSSDDSGGSVEGDSSSSDDDSDVQVVGEVTHDGGMGDASPFGEDSRPVAGLRGRGRGGRGRGRGGRPPGPARRIGRPPGRGRGRGGRGRGRGRSPLADSDTSTMDEDADGVTLNGGEGGSGMRAFATGELPAPRGRGRGGRPSGRGRTAGGRAAGAKPAGSSGPMNESDAAALLMMLFGNNSAAAAPEAEDNRQQAPSTHEQEDAAGQLAGEGPLAAAPGGTDDPGLVATEVGPAPSQVDPATVLAGAEQQPATGGEAPSLAAANAGAAGAGPAGRTAEDAAGGAVHPLQLGASPVRSRGPPKEAAVGQRQEQLPSPPRPVQRHADGAPGGPVAANGPGDSAARPTAAFLPTQRPLSKKEATEAVFRVFEQIAERNVQASLLTQWMSTLYQVLELYEQDPAVAASLRSCLNGLAMSVKPSVQLADVEAMLRNITKLLQGLMATSSAAAAAPR